jgi:enterochelin esterase-like enzyme
MVDRYAANLKRLRAIALDVGTHDSLILGAQAFDRALTDAGVPHSFETYDGDHLNRIELRFGQNVLPFFAQHLRFNPQ